MDRQELEERARQLHGQGSPFHRGAGSDESSSAGDWSTPSVPGEFVPEPSDELARRPDSGTAEEPQRIDNLAERPLTPASAAAPPPPSMPVDAVSPGELPASQPPITPPSLAVPPVIPAGPPGEPVQGYDPPIGYEPRGDAAGDRGRYPASDYRGGGNEAGGYRAGGSESSGHDDRGHDAGGYDDGGYDYGGPGYGGPDWPRDEGPRGRSTALPILGFVVLGVAALLGGAVLFSALNAPGGVAEQSATPSATQSASAAASETPNGSPTDSGAASASTEPSAGATPDTFTARAEPCASNDMGFGGCAKDGTTLSGTQVWVWVGFKNAQAANVLGVTIVDKAGGTEVGDGSLELDKLTGCDPGKTCSGYIQMTFGDLSPGSYTIRVTRDGTQVAATDFTVTA